MHPRARRLNRAQSPLSHSFRSVETVLNIRFVAVICVCIGVAPPAGAAEILDARVELVGERYRIHFAVMIEGDAVPLRRIVTDYPRLDALSPTVTGSRLISGRAGRDARVEITLRPCVLVIFCRTITKVSDSRVGPEGEWVQYRTVPGLSDFHEGYETITMREAANGDAPRVHFVYSAVLKPGFYVPPFVGPWLIRRQIIHDLEATSRRVERMLRGEAVDGER